MEIEDEEAQRFREEGDNEDEEAPPTSKNQPATKGSVTKKSAAKKNKAKGKSKVSPGALLEGADVVTLKDWWQAIDEEDKPAFYELFREIYHRFYAEGVKSMLPPTDEEIAVENADLAIELEDGVDESSELSNKKSHKILEEKEINAPETRSHQELLDEMTQALEVLNTPERRALRQTLGITRQQLDLNDTKIPEISDLQKDVVVLRQLIMRRRSNSTVKVNHYVGRRERYVLRHNDTDDIRHGDKIIHPNEPLALALVTHLTPCTSDTTKARPFYYLAHLAATPQIKSHGWGQKLLKFIQKKADDTDTPIFLELDEKEGWRGLQNFYENNGFHTGEEMQNTEDNAAWTDWYQFFDEACRKGWTTTAFYTDSIYQTFTKHTNGRDRKLWMVYWNQWPKHAPGKLPMPSHLSVAIADEASKEPEVLGDAASPVPVYDSKLLPEDLIAMPSRAWADLYTQRIVGREVTSELEGFLLGTEGVRSQMLTENLCKRFPHLTVSDFIAPFSRAPRRNRSALYEFEFRNYVLIAPRAGLVPIEPDPRINNNVMLESGEPCAFAICILLWPVAGQDCPPLWVVESMGVCSKDKRLGDTTSDVFLRRMCSLLQTAAASQKMLLLLNAGTFQTEYNWLLRSMGFVFGEETYAAMSTHAGGAFTAFFLAHRDDNAMKYTLDHTQPKGQRTYARIYTASDCPANSRKWAVYWGGEYPIEVSTHTWAQRLRGVTPMSRFDVLHKTQTAVIDPENKSTFAVLPAREWARECGGNTLGLNMAHFVRMYMHFEKQLPHAQTHRTRVKHEQFCWSASQKALSVNRQYTVVHDVYVLHASNLTPRGFARIYQFTPAVQDAEGLLRPFVFVKEAFAYTPVELGLLLDGLHYALSPCMLLTSLGTKEETSIFKRREVGYVHAHFTPCVTLRTEKPLYAAFFQYVAASVDIAVQLQKQMEICINEDPTANDSKESWMIRRDEEVEEAEDEELDAEEVDDMVQALRSATEKAKHAIQAEQRLYADAEIDWAVARSNLATKAQKSHPAAKSKGQKSKTDAPVVPDLYASTGTAADALQAKYATNAGELYNAFYSAENTSASPVGGYAMEKKAAVNTHALHHDHQHMYSKWADDRSDSWQGKHMAVEESDDDDDDNDVDEPTSVTAPAAAQAAPTRKQKRGSAHGPGVSVGDSSEGTGSKAKKRTKAVHENGGMHRDLMQILEKYYTKMRTCSQMEGMVN